MPRAGIKHQKFLQADEGPSSPLSHSSIDRHHHKTHLWRPFADFIGPTSTVTQDRQYSQRCTRRTWENNWLQMPGPGTGGSPLVTPLLFDILRILDSPPTITMAELVALCAALTRMGFSPAVASSITDMQGMNDLEEFLLMDDEGVGTLCKAIHRPGGQIPNPAFAVARTAAAAAATGIPANISNPGYVVSTRAETNLKLMCYFLRYRRSTSHDTEAAVITLNAVRSMKTHKDWEVNHVDVEALEINNKDWARTFEAIDEWLRGCLGEFSKIPLAYVIRDNEAITADPVAPATWPSK